MSAIRKIKKIKIYKSKQRMYDLSVRGDKSYNSNGIFVHNSETCKYMDGQVLEVSRTIERWKLYDDAETTDDVKAVNPWITDKGGILSVGSTTLTPDLTGEEIVKIRQVLRQRAAIGAILTTAFAGIILHLVLNQ